MTPNPKENAKEKTARAKQQRADLLSAIRRTFSTPEGQRTLAFLHATSASGSPAFQPSKDGNFCPIAAAFRNGRQSIILEIQAAIAAPSE